MSDLPKSPTSVVPFRALKEGFRALGVRNYRLYWIGQLISISGTWMQTTAQAWVVYSLTNSPMALGTVTTLQFLPIMLLSLFGGVLADRVPKRQVVLITQIASLIQAALFGLLVAMGVIQVWHIYILALVQGIINAIDNPVRQAFAAELVSREDRANAIALNSMLFNGARVIGPALAGILIAKTGAATALFLNAASFLAIIIAVIIMDPALFFTVPLSQQRESPFQQLAEGLRYTWQTPTVLIVMIIVGFIGTFGYNFSVVLPLLGGFVLHTDAVGFGALSAALGIGSSLGALSAAFFQRVSLRWLMIGSAGFSIFLGAVAVSTQMWLSELLLVILGFFGVMFSTNAATLIQTTVADRLRGRVTSLYFLLFAGSTPIGAYLIGTLSSNLNVTDALLICAALCLVGVVFSLGYERFVIERHAH
ncbi:MAG: MFS transporter [Caldilineaceae bacterium]